MPLSEHVAGVLLHKREVSRCLQLAISDLMQRALIHDDSKLSEEEANIFEEQTPRLKTLTYGTQEYQDSLKALGPALEHHYRMNDHHPEHFPEGVRGMTLMQLLEMLSDWIAAGKRVANGDIQASLEINKERFGIDDQLFAILANTVLALQDLYNI